MFGSSEPEVLLRERIQGACQMLIEHPQYKGPRKSDFSPIAHTQWKHRGSDWVPDDPYKFTKRIMKRSTLDEICSALVDHKDASGRPIVPAHEIDGIVSAWKGYQARVGQHSDFDVDKALKATGITKSDLRDVDVFRTFLFGDVYPLITAGHAKEAKRRVTSLLETVCSEGKISASKRAVQIQACVALLAFISYVSEDGSEAVHLSRMKRMYALDDQNMFLRGRILAHGGHHVMGSRNFAEVLKLRLLGADLDLPTYERAASSCYHNAVRAALQCGATLDWRSSHAKFKSLKDVLCEGEEISGLHGDADSRGRHTILRAMSSANAGNYQEALGHADDVRSLLDENRQDLRHLALRLAKVETTIYSRLIDKCIEIKSVVQERLSQAESLARDLNLPITLKRVQNRRLHNPYSTDWIV